MTVWKDHASSRPRRRRRRSGSPRARSRRRRSHQDQGPRQEPAYLITPQAITKANWRCSSRRGYLKRADICNGESAQYCKYFDSQNSTEAPWSGASVVPVIERPSVSDSASTRAPRRHQVVRLRPGPDRRRLRGARRRGDGARRRHRRRQVDADQVCRRHPPDGLGPGLLRGQAGRHGPKDAAKLGIEIVYQDLALCDNLDVPEHVPRARGERLVRAAERAADGGEDVRDAEVARVTTIRSIRQPVATLSGGQRQSVAVARAVMWNSRLVILDEPTAALGVSQTEQVLALVSPRRAGACGRPDLAQPPRHLRGRKRITVLRLGRDIGVYDRASTRQEEIVHAITAGTPTKVAGIPGPGTEHYS